MAQKGYIKNSVTADLGAPELAAIFKGLLPTNGIINLWDDLACARINDNLVRLSPGVYNLSGYLLGVMQGTTADLAVDSGTAGYNRIDLVVAEFVRNGGGAGVDTLQFKIVKGTSTTGTPADPTLTADDINVEANTTRQEALYRLTITGTTMAAPELMASVLDNIDTVTALIGDIATNLLTATDGQVLKSNGDGTGTFEDLTVPCKAWVNFNGTGTVAIRASYNVSSITDNGTGDYTVNMATSLADANYSAVVTRSGNNISGGGNAIAFATGANAFATSHPSSSAFRIYSSQYWGSTDGLTRSDADDINVAIFR